MVWNFGIITTIQFNDVKVKVEVKMEVKVKVKLG